MGFSEYYGVILSGKWKLEGQFPAEDDIVAMERSIHIVSCLCGMSGLLNVAIRTMPMLVWLKTNFVPSHCGWSVCHVLSLLTFQTACDTAV